MFHPKKLLRFSLGMMLFVVLWISGYLGGYKVGYDVAYKGIDNQIVVAESYPVADLVLSWDPKLKQPDFDSLISLIKSSVMAEYWDGRRGVWADPDSLSIVVAQTKSGHEEVNELLGQLRRNLQVYTARTRINKCGHCGKGELPELGQPCTICNRTRHDPP